ncbi:carboxypeptidase-like regulatory domain-containing protein [uncultured Dokdonia sp.]|uniref:carboxypeptidase-like regulatory domain-containing protein n=1 Tax=uncultured Dokdonia sp. TaxID=575653 RepID=UPI00261262FF|nr:carboxypeptidase-like regulatory domain-containing protein [uncultured Dokdonia sp.]
MIKSTLLLFCFLACCAYTIDVKAQYISNDTNSSLKARVINQDTKKPIPFVNVGFIGKGIGSVTDGQGYFELTYDSRKIKGSDIIQFSIIGFKTKQIQIASISTILSKNNIITLSPERYSLEEVVLGDTKIKNATIGNSKIDAEKFGYWKNELGLGGEIASKIKIKKEKTQLKSLSFPVLENLSDSIRVRVNVYDIDPIFRIPQNNILNTTIYHTISRREGIERIPLSKYNIFTDTDIIVSIELIEIYGDRLGFAVAGSANKNASFTRSISQDYWQPHKKEAMAFTMDVSYPLKKGAKETLDRPSPNAITVFWDASAKANNRNISLELELLERYLRVLKNVDVTVQKFAFGYQETQIFTVKKEASDAVIEYIESTIYGGTSDYSLLREKPEQQHYNLLFTDGNSLFSDLQPSFNNTTFTLSSAENIDKEVLEEVALYADGVFINLNTYTSKKALEFLLKDLPTDTTIQKPNTLKVTGKITSEIGLLDGARIAVRGTFNEVISDSLGTFEIEAQVGDQLEIRFPGMKTKLIRVTSNKKVQIALETEGDWLKEIVLKGKKKEKEEALVQTASGKKNFDAVTFKTNIIREEDISPAFLTLGDVLKRLSSIRVEQNPITREEVYINPRAISITQQVLPVVVVNGVVYEQANGGVPPINPQDLLSVQVITSLHANALYGTLGRGGAIIVETKSGNPEYYAQKNQRAKIPSALIKGNDYVAEDVAVLDDNINKPFYLIQLEKATTLEEALNTYYDYKNTTLEDPIVFYTDVATYFQKWNKNIALRILSNLPETLSGDIEVLKLMAYHLESFNEFQLANTLYKRILTLAPDRIQSYRDLAISHQEIGNYQQAFELFKQILANETVGLNFLPLKKTAEYEMMRLLTFHKSKVSYEDVSNELLVVGFKKDRRLVFEWTNPQADFEIQFVNPKGKYFKWEHSVFSNQERLKDEVTKGYSIEEFALDDAPPGEWIINVQYLGEDRIQPPSYLKYTLYLNYATPQETKEIKLIKLFQQKDKTTLGTLTLR